MFGTMELKARSRERLGENISKFILARSKTNFQLFTKDLLASKMIINFKVLSPRVENMICRQGNGRDIITPDNRYMMKKDAKHLKLNAKARTTQLQWWLRRGTLLLWRNETQYIVSWQTKKLDLA